MKLDLNDLDDKDDKDLSSDDSSEDEEDEKELMDDSALYLGRGTKGRLDSCADQMLMDQVLNHIQVEQKKKENPSIKSIVKEESKRQLELVPQTPSSKRKQMMSHVLEEAEVNFEPHRTMHRVENVMRGNSAEATPRHTIEIDKRDLKESRISMGHEMLGDIGRKKSSRHLENQTKRESRKNEKFR